MNTIDQIRDYLHARQSDMLRDLIALCTIPSVRGEPAPGAPFGVECTRCLEAAAQLFRDNGFEAEVYADSGYALASCGDGEESIGIFSHVDVVPVTPEDWLITRPFDILVRDGVVYGRGVRDDKCGVVSSLYIMRAIRDLGIPMKHRLIAFMGANEESGMADIRAFIREQPHPAACTVPDTSLPFSLGERGIHRLDVIGSKPMHDIIALEGGKAYNMVMPALRCTLRRSEALLSELRAIREAWLDVRTEDSCVCLTVQGSAAHAGSPAAGISALKRLCSVLLRLPSLNPADAAQFARAAHVLSDTDGTALGIANTDPVHGALTVANGMVSLTEGRMCFTLDIRSGNAYTAEELGRRIAAAMQPCTFEARIHSSSRAFDIPFDDPVARCVNEAIQGVTGAGLTNPMYMGGGSYSKPLYLQTGAPSFTVCICTPKGEPRNLPEGHGSVHQPDEALPIDGFLEATLAHAGIILALDKQI